MRTMLMSPPAPMRARSSLRLPPKWALELYLIQRRLPMPALSAGIGSMYAKIDARVTQAGMLRSEGKAGHGVKIFPIIVLVLLALSGSSYAASCSFVSLPGTLSFGNLDPGVGTNVIRTSTLTISCNGPDPIPFSITDDDGLYETGVNAGRMRNTAVPTEFLPYSIAYAGSG